MPVQTLYCLSEPPHMPGITQPFNPGKMKSLYSFILASLLFIGATACTDNAVEPDFSATNITIQDQEMNGGTNSEDPPPPPPPGTGSGN